ncbi:hypothetical protein D6T69_06855 [Tenacibaculum singaporense]|uniref:Uncharacterized protein n=1 Tax=Tenacibaculum singaporense TaxID=2358479 RepID=A0A3Q8RQA0_9FLAO|nr:hypothetical protein [Tenacibaculum singaporense]AZJ35252.1 hypothetical protein D6T69_06855 [Tenacibaculum singaporense]
MIYTTTFLDFIEETRFLKLQNKFASYDVNSYPYDETYEKIVEGDFKVLEKDINPITEEEIFVYKSFYEDFIIPSISTLAGRYINYFKNKTENEMFEEEKIASFARHQLNRLFKIEIKAKEINYLNDVSKDLFIKQIKDVIDFLSDDYIIPSFSLDRKIKVKMNKTDIIVLFLLLRENKKIVYYTNTEFRLILEKTFLYFNEKDKTYYDISTKPTTISDILNGNRPINNSLKRLKNLFQGEEFYNTLN